MVLAALLVFPPYWKVDLSAISAPIRTGITGEGHFWIGAEKPELDITEFTDYQCFQCKKMHYYLRKLVARYPDRIRLTHFNFPMDQESNPIVTEPFHVGSGRMALLAIHAAVKGKFIEMNDLLYTKGATGQTIKLKDIAEETGMDLQQLASALTYEPYQRHLSRDIRSGMKLRIVGTPSYQINGSVYEGNIPANILEPFLKDGKS
jgi:protein-disulfide isomerase